MEEEPREVTSGFVSKKSLREGKLASSARLGNANPRLQRHKLSNMTQRTSPYTERSCISAGSARFSVTRARMRRAPAALIRWHRPPLRRKGAPRLLRSGWRRGRRAGERQRHQADGRRPPARPRGASARRALRCARAVRLASSAVRWRCIAEQAGRRSASTSPTAARRRSQSEQFRQTGLFSTCLAGSGPG